MLKRLSKAWEANFFLLKREVRRRHKIFASPAPSMEASPGSAITIARVIGNDLYPRHADGQSTKNLEFILENEPDFPGCRKVFVINRLFDPQREKMAVEMVQASGHTALVLPFVDHEYAECKCDPSVPGDPWYMSDTSVTYRFKGKEVQRRLLACADKICYAMNINGARNIALKDGRCNSEWTLVLDGSCFVSRQVFETLKSDLFRRPVTPYVIVPMARLQSNEVALTQIPQPNRVEEPQVAFHRNSTEKFDERLPYGLRDKTSLLDRLGVPGPWSHWKRVKGMPKREGRSAERYHYKYASTCVFRLTSGAKGGQLEAAFAQRERYDSRNTAIFQSLATLDKRVARLQNDFEARSDPSEQPDELEKK